MTDTRWDAVAALVDPARRALYDHVRRQDHPVTREEAADAVAISRNLAAFHLDKLVDAGLLHARYESPADQPRGRGRTPKVYEADPSGLSLTMPPRQYELLGHILTDAISQTADAVPDAVRTNAHRYGVDVGASCLARRDGTGPGRDLAAAHAAFAELGFEPRTADGLVLANCPFHALAQRHRELICGLNEAFVAGVLTGLRADTLRARLQPQPGACCVRVTADRATG